MAPDDDAEAILAVWTEAYIDPRGEGRRDPTRRRYDALGYRRAPERDDADRDGLRLVFGLDLGADKLPA